MRTPEQAKSLSDYIEPFRRRTWLVALTAPPVFLLSILLAFVLPSEYESTATVLLESSTVPKDMIETSVISYSNQQIEIVQGRVMTPETLERLVQEYDPYPGDAGMSDARKARQVLQDTTIEKVDPVTMNPVVESNAFSLHYRNADAERAAEVTSRLAQLFLTYNQRVRSEAAVQATDFLRQQSETVTAKMRAIDTELADLKSRAGDAFPDLYARNQSALERSQHDLDTLNQQILSSESRESLLALQLSQLSPNLMTQSGDLTDLATVRAQLAEAEQRYTADHPIVKRLRRSLEMLVAQNSGVGITTANNPQYLTAQSQLAAVRKELASLRAQAGKAREQIATYSSLLHQSPAVEREYAEIARRKQVAQTEYQQLHDKLQSAQLAQSFETEQRGERFTLLRAPMAASSPAYPNRLGLVLLGLVLGCGLAAVAVVVAEAMDSRVRHSRDLPEIRGVVMLASIPVIQNTRDRRRRKLMVSSYAAAAGVMLVVIGVTMFSALYR